MSDRLNEFFAREAAEYLAELDGLLRSPGAPSPDEFLRLSTGIRGSVQMAEADGVVVLAEALEDAARSIASGGAEWTDRLRSLAADTVSDLRELVAALGTWRTQEDDRLQFAISRWDSVNARRAGGGTESHGARIVPISDLFYDDAGPHILGEGEGAPGWQRGAEAAGAVATRTTPVAEAVATPTTPVAEAVATPTTPVAEAIAAPPAFSGSTTEASSAIRGSGADPGTALSEPQVSESSGPGASDPARSDTVPIEDLLFSGPAAIREALTLRPRIEEAARNGASESLDALIAELFDLVELGTGVGHPNEG